MGRTAAASGYDAVNHPVCRTHHSQQVTFIGEEGLDAGGVQKEFFMLLLQAILNPDFGMFIEDPESHLIWFRDQVIDLHTCTVEQKTVEENVSGIWTVS